MNEDQVIASSQMHLYRMLTTRTDEGPVPDALGPAGDEVSLSGDQNTLLWLSIDVPRTTPAGVYAGSIGFTDGGEPKDIVPFSVNVWRPTESVEPLQLDLWQGWSALERHYHLEPFSDEWWETVRRYLECLAQTGAEVVQVSRRYVGWRRVIEGQYQFDFENFDRYVRLCTRLGITGPIEYLAMVDTTGPTRVYIETPEDEMVSRTVKPGDELYDEAWSAFLRSLAKHCRTRGWQQRLRIFVGDRPSPEDVEHFRRAAELVKTASDQIVTTATVDNPAVAQELAGMIDRLVLPLGNSDAAMGEIATQLRDSGRPPACYIESTSDMLTAGADRAQDIPSLARERGFSDILISNFARWPDDLVRTPDGFRTEGPFRSLVYPGEEGPLLSLRLQRLLLTLQAGWVSSTEKETTPRPEE